MELNLTKNAVSCGDPGRHFYYIDSVLLPEHLARIKDCVLQSYNL